MLKALVYRAMHVYRWFEYKVLKIRYWRRVIQDDLVTVSVLIFSTLTLIPWTLIPQIIHSLTKACIYVLFSAMPTQKMTWLAVSTLRSTSVLLKTPSHESSHCADSDYRNHPLRSRQHLHLPERPLHPLLSRCAPISSPMLSFLRAMSCWSSISRRKELYQALHV